MKITIIIYGPPGSGKGTQAKLLAERLGIVHFDTGKFIEKVVHDPANKKDKIVQRERKFFDSGILCTPSWVLKIVSQRAKQLASSNLGIVFSGSPRTLFEAFGDKKQTGLIKTLERYYEKRNVFVFLVHIPPKDSLRRNGNRIICSVCGTQLIATFKKVAELKICPFCGGKLYRRTLDNPEIIKTRIKEYQDRTIPIAKTLEKRGYRIIWINGEPLPAKVNQSILKHLPVKN